jgi:hypothetical protein
LGHYQADATAQKSVAKALGWVLGVKDVIFLQTNSRARKYSWCPLQKAEKAAHLASQRNIAGEDFTTKQRDGKTRLLAALLQTDDDARSVLYSTEY